MNRWFGVFAVFAVFLGALTFSVHASLIVDFSPDTTGVAVESTNYTDSLGQGQIIGDQFTISTGVTLTGGSIFGGSSIGAVGTPVDFMIFGNPDSAPIIDIASTIDAFDSVSTTTQSTLSRKHVTITPTFLAAGTYWFAMPSSGDQNWVVGTGDYADNSFRIGTTTLSNSVPGVGDVFFQLEGSVPEPTTVSFLSLAALTLLRRNRNRRMSARSEITSS